MRLLRALPLFVALAGLLAPTATSAQQIRLSGSLSGDGPVQVGMLGVMVEAAARFTEFVEQPADDFEVVVESNRPVIALMRVGSRMLTPFWLEPGADVRLEQVGEGEDASYRVTGEGSAGPAFILTEGYEERWKEHLGAFNAETATGPDATDLGDYLERADDVAREMDAVVRDASLSELYEQILLAENVARLNRIRDWALADLAPTADERAAIEARQVADVVARADAPGTAYAVRYIEDYGDHLDRIYRETVLGVGGTTSPSGFYHFRRAAAGTPELRDGLAAEVMGSMLRTEDFTRELTELVEDFARTSSTEEARAYIEATADQRQQLAPGATAPPLVAERLEGGMQDLTEFRGRTVLLTVWGSWCYWSRQELPHLEALRARMAETDPEIAFVNLGWDQDGPWRDAVHEFGLGGTNLLSTEEIRSTWAITGTPDFIVIAPDGTIVTTDAPRPNVDGGDALAAVLREVAAR